jgi:cytolysin-activating lysine-acyltransferase
MAQQNSGDKKEKEVQVDQTASAQATAPKGVPMAAEVFGHVTWLMLNSPAHKHLFVSDLEWLAVPAVSLKQFRIYMQEGTSTPIAFVSWAYLTEETEQRLLSGQRKLSPVEWNEGDRPWIIDIITPFGATEEILRSVKKNVFPDQDVKTLIPGEDGTGVRVMTIRAKEEKTDEKPAAKKKASSKKATETAAE